MISNDLYSSQRVATQQVQEGHGPFSSIHCRKVRPPTVVTHGHYSLTAHFSAEERGGSLVYSGDLAVAN